MSDTRTGLRSACKRLPPSRFLHYRDFLSALRDEVERVRGERYTYQQLGVDLGLPAASGAYIVIHGYRKLNDEQVSAIVEQLGLAGTEKRYFLELRRYADAATSEERLAAFKEMVALKEQALPETAERRRLRFFTEWYHAAIFELVDLPEFRSDPEWIASRFYKRLTVEQVRKSLTLLEDLGLIAYDDNAGRHVKRATSLSTGDDPAGLAIVGYHLQMLSLSESALSAVPADEREIGAVTLAVDGRVAERLREDLRLFRRYVMFLSEQCEAPDRIVQLNAQLFALTRGA